jgi:hypothetical protein
VYYCVYGEEWCLLGCNVSEEFSASFIRLIRIGEKGTKQAVKRQQIISRVRRVVVKAIAVPS